MDDEKSFEEERDNIVKGLEETYRRLVETKKRTNSPMIVFKDGKIVEINPNDILPTIVYKRIS